jgi:hypothetical protein
MILILNMMTFDERDDDFDIDYDEDDDDDDVSILHANNLNYQLRGNGMSGEIVKRIGTHSIEISR